MLGCTTKHMGLAQVTAPNDQEANRQCYTTKMEIERVCLEEAKCRFTQAKDTPMLQLPMLNMFGIDQMDTPEFAQILDGMFQFPKECNPYLQKLLSHLQKPEGLLPIMIQQYDEYKHSWERAREMTALLPSLVHFGHYIAAIAEESIGKLNTILANVRLLSGTAPEWWKQTLNVMLENSLAMTMSKNYASLCYLKLTLITTTSG